ncbi:MAG TPA: ion channel [Edaphobacter sp.]|nr:ion channel [Edaphobacter sp.]
MLLLLMKRRIQRWWSKAPWLTLLALLLALYVMGYLMMLWREPAGSPIHSLATYTYFFVITVTTVGFGDVVPVTTAGRLTASVIAVGGIGAAAVALSSVFASIGNYIKRREKGFLEFDMKGHIVIFGNRGGETTLLIQRLVADQQSRGTQIVLCSQTTERNPFPDLIEFVRGELTSNDVMARACVKDAGKVIIHASTDYESISIALAVKEINPSAPIVVKANDPGKEVDIERVDRRRVVCVRSTDVPMMVREIHNPGITRVFENLLSPEGQDLRSIRVPDGKAFNFGRLAHHFREEHGAILIGMRPDGAIVTSQGILNPVFDSSVEGGMFLDYISRSPVTIEWEALKNIQT